MKLLNRSRRSKLFLEIAGLVSLCMILMLIFSTVWHQNQIETRNKVVSLDLDRNKDFIGYAYDHTEEADWKFSIKSVLATLAAEHRLSYIGFYLDDIEKLAYPKKENICTKPETVDFDMPDFEPNKGHLKYCLDQTTIAGFSRSELVWLAIGFSLLLIFGTYKIFDKISLVKESSVITNELLHVLGDITSRAIAVYQATGERHFGYMSDVRDVHLEMKGKKRDNEIQDIDIGSLVSFVAWESEYILAKNITIDNAQVIKVLSKVDPLKFKAVFRVLVNNSSQAIGEKVGKITITPEIDENSNLVNFSVFDNGPGIPDEIRSKLFQPKKDGHGYGLSSSRKYVESWGGKLEYVPTPSGTMFRVTLPITVYRVLIDNEFSTRLVWKKKAESMGLQVKVFASIDEFIAQYRTIPFSTPITIDSRLGGGVRGEDESIRIYQLGFKNLFLASSTKVDLSEKYWLKEGSKEPIFEKKDDQGV